MYEQRKNYKYFNYIDIILKLMQILSDIDLKIAD